MPLNNHKVLIIGLGSMGKRRIRNLLFWGLSKQQIFGLDTSLARCREAAKEYGIKTFDVFNKADKEIDPDVYIICTSPLRHHEYFLHAAKKKKHFFVEATTATVGYAELKPLLDGSFVAAPSCTFRHFPAVKKIKELLSSGAIGKSLVFNHYLGQYLPDWHPYEDYRQVYFSKKDTGGAREMFPYELVWLTGIFKSSVKKVTGVRGRISDLEITADDIYSSIVQFENGVVGSMMIDLLNRKACRTIKIIGTVGTLDWNWLEKEIKIFNIKNNNTEIVNLDGGKKIGQYNTEEDAYEAEIGDFLQAIAGKKKYLYSFPEDEAILKCLDSFIDIGQ